MVAAFKKFLIGFALDSTVKHCFAIYALKILIFIRYFKGINNTNPITRYTLHCTVGSQRYEHLLTKDDSDGMPKLILYCSNSNNVE